MPEDSRQESDVIRYNKAHYGVLISEARRRAGLTQLDVARALGISKNIVTHWEAGRVKPDLNLIPRLCGVLGLTLEDFFQQPSAGDRLTRREQALLEAYRSLPGRDRLILESALFKALEMSDSQLWERCRTGFVTLLRFSLAGVEFREGSPVRVRRGPMAERAREIVTVSGDAMRPKYTDGQDVYLEDAADIAIGEIGVFIVNGAAYLRQRQADRLRSLNPVYPDIPLRDADDVRCRGRVLGAVSPSDYPTREEQAILDEIGASPDG